MNRNLTIWIAGAMFVVFLPLLFIVLEGVTRPQRLSAARIGETEETTKSEQGVRTTSSEFVDAAIVNSVSDATGILKETTTVISEAPAKTPSNERTRLDQLPTADPEAESPFTNSFISDIGFFGGATDSLRGENLVATVIDPSVSPSIDSASTGAIGLAVSGTTKTSPGEKSLPPLPIMKTAVMFPSPVSLTRSRLMQRTASPA